MEEPEEASQAKEEDRGGQTSSTDSVYEPIVLREAPVTPGSTGHPMPNYSETMEFRVEVKKASVKPCHSRYHPVMSVRYRNADQTGVTSVQLQVLGLGGSRIVCAAPHASDRVWKISQYPQDNGDLVQGHPNTRKGASIQHGFITITVTSVVWSLV